MTTSSSQKILASPKHSTMATWDWLLAWLPVIQFSIQANKEDSIYWSPPEYKSHSPTRFVTAAFCMFHCPYIMNIPIHNSWPHISREPESNYVKKWTKHTATILHWNKSVRYSLLISDKDLHMVNDMLARQPRTEHWVILATEEVSTMHASLLTY